VRAWVRAYRPRALVLEATYGHPVESFAALHRLASTTRRLAKAKHLRVATYAPQTVRKSLTGDGWASKRELAQAIVLRFPALRVYLTQDRKWKERYFLNLFDAVGLALHHQATALIQPPSRSLF
jgi:Holliday junction resolvasome RuvABC endonuclease subunit